MYSTQVRIAIKAVISDFRDFGGIESKLMLQFLKLILCFRGFYIDTLSFMVNAPRHYPDYLCGYEG